MTQLEELKQELEIIKSNIKRAEQMEFTIRELRHLIKLVKADMNEKKLGSDQFMFIQGLNDKLEKGLKESISNAT